MYIVGRVKETPPKGAGTVQVHFVGREPAWALDQRSSEIMDGDKLGGAADAPTLLPTMTATSND